MPVVPIRTEPPIPTFIIDRSVVGGFPCNRAERTSVQRFSPSVVVPRPSVIESPIATMPWAEASAITSIAEMKNQRTALVAEAMSAASTVVLPLWK